MEILYKIELHNRAALCHFTRNGCLPCLVPKVDKTSVLQTLQHTTTTSARHWITLLSHKDTKPWGFCLCKRIRLRKTFFLQQTTAAKCERKRHLEKIIRGLAHSRHHNDRNLVTETENQVCHFSHSVSWRHWGSAKLHDNSVKLLLLRPLLPTCRRSSTTSFQYSFL